MRPDANAAILLAAILATYTVARAAEPAPPAPVLTGKERLGQKWTDAQRVDNCDVPADKRGPTLRPDDCAGYESDER